MTKKKTALALCSLLGCILCVIAGCGKLNTKETVTPAEAVNENAWMQEREAIVTLWNVNAPRGIFVNSNTSLKTDIMSFSEEQLRDYVKMLKFCGFTGVQVTDMCSAWAYAGGVDFVQERIRILADAAHVEGMNFTLWVWGAEFTGYGWVDNSVTYDKGEYSYAYENPDVVASFEKYYDYYAELADCSDRVIAHFYDPGNLTEAEDVAFFSKMLRDKMKKKNPDLDFGVSCWVDCFDKKTLVKKLGKDITLYEGMQHGKEESYAPFRQMVSDLGCRLGTWAWNTCEMEIDQLAQMDFQPTIIQETYKTLREYDGIMPSSYWSEMDSNHVMNVFSLYCAGHLLQDPELDVQDLTYEVALKTVGEEYASDFAEMLSLIEEARSGYTWNTFFWDTEEYILKSDEYPSEDIINKSERLLPVLQEMIDKGIEANEMPLPISLHDLLSLMKPQMMQIYEYALFRRDFDALKTGTDSKQELEEKLQELSKPIPEYNCVIGLWGQIEARAQRELILEFCKEKNLKIPEVPDFDMNRKYRIYQYFVHYQKGKEEPVMQSFPYFQYGVAYGEEETVRLVNELVEEGVFSKNEDGRVYLTEWENYRYLFND